MLRVSVKFVAVGAVVRADELEARQPAYTWTAVQKRGAITLQKNSVLAGVITFL